MNDTPSKWPTQELRSGWNHPEFRKGDNVFDIVLAEGDELARMQRVFHTTQQDVVEYLCEDALPLPYVSKAETYKGGRGTYAERLAATQADRRFAREIAAIERGHANDP